MNCKENGLKKFIKYILCVIVGIILTLAIFCAMSNYTDVYGTMPPWISILVSALSAAANFIVIYQSSTTIKNNSLQFERSYCNSTISSLIPVIMEKAKNINDCLDRLVKNYSDYESSHRDCCNWTTNFIQCFQIINTTSGENEDINKKCMNIFIKILTTDVSYELKYKEFSRKSLYSKVFNVQKKTVEEAYGHYDYVRHLYEQYK